MSCTVWNVSAPDSRAASTSIPPPFHRCGHSVLRAFVDDVHTALAALEPLAHERDDGRELFLLVLVDHREVLVGS